MKLTDHVYYVGVKDPGLKVFDIIMDTEFGTTYNAYLVKGEKTALIETAHDKLSENYIKNVEEIQDISKIDYVILNHTEPDHSGSLIKILEKNPDIQVVGTIAALKNLKAITNRTFREVLAKDGESLDLGNGIVLQFIIAPNLHWPDTMMTYLAAEKILFSCDVLGSHYCFDGLTDEEVTNKADYERAFKVYYDCIVSPFKPFVLKGLEKIGGLDIQMVCTSHGPVLKKFIAENVQKYQEWSTPHPNTQKIAAIYYVSAYGYTKKIADAMAVGLKKCGIDVRSYDIIQCGWEEMQETLHHADGILFGSPTINRNALKPVWDVISCIDVITMKDIPIGIFGSYGWSGEACGLLEQHLKALRLNVFETPQKVLFNPSEEDLENAKQYAKRFAEVL